MQHVLRLTKGREKKEERWENQEEEVGERGGVERGRIVEIEDVDEFDVDISW